MIVPFTHPPMRREAAVRLYATGKYNSSEAARIAGVARETLRGWVRKANAPLRPRGRPRTELPENVVEQFREMRAEGWSGTRIRDHLRIGHKRYAELLRQVGVGDGPRMRCQECYAVYPMGGTCPNNHGRTA